MDFIRQHILQTFPANPIHPISTSEFCKRQKSHLNAVGHCFHWSLTPATICSFVEKPLICKASSLICATRALCSFLFMPLRGLYDPANPVRKENAFYHLVQAASLRGH